MRYQIEKIDVVVLAGLRHFSGAPLVLFITADLPLVTAAAINDFVDSSGKMGTAYSENVFWALLPEESFSGPYRRVEKDITGSGILRSAMSTFFL
jgi:hypothetical protein